MRPNPLTDALAFLVETDKFWFTVIFWLLLLGSVAAALQAWRTDSAQRSARHICIGVLRFIVGCMWWQQSLWKIPPHYDWGLIHWMQEMVEHASTELQSVLVRDLVLPNISVFGPLVYAIEAAIATSLILGLFTRLGAALGALMAINLWLGLTTPQANGRGPTCSWLSFNCFFSSTRQGAASASTSFFAVPRLNPVRIRRHFLWFLETRASDPTGSFGRMGRSLCITANQHLECSKWASVVLGVPSRCPLYPR